MPKVEDQIDRIGFYASEAIRFLGNADLSEFSKDHKTIAATSMMIVAMAEIVKELPESFKDKNPEIEWLRIAGMRNRLAHDYQGLNTSILYQVIRNNLPGLLDQLGQVRY